MTGRGVEAHFGEGKAAGSVMMVNRSQALLDETEESMWAQRQIGRIVARKDIMLREAGSLRESLTHSFSMPGRFLRPLLLLGFSASSLQTSNPDDNIIDAAAAIESLHECSLLHDDVIDHSTMRRGQASVAAAFNVRTAAHAGFYLAGRAIAILAGACRDSGVNIDLHMLRHLAQAQIIETLPPASNPEDHLARIRTIIKGKTGVLLHLAVEIGARFGAQSGGQVLAEPDLARFSEAIAMAYQIRDDVLDLEMDPRLRRPGNNDIRSGTPSWPVTLWIGSEKDSQKAWLRLRDAGANPTTAEQLRTAVLGSGTVGRAHRCVGERLDEARELLLSLRPSLGRTVLLRLLDHLRLDPL